MATTNGDKPDRLVVFDVEGVLLPTRRYLLLVVARKLGPWRFVKAIVIGFLYEVGLLSLKSALKRIFALFQGFTVEDLFDIYREIPPTPGAERVFEELKRAEYRSALISSGLPKPFVEDLAARLGADYSFGLIMGLSEGRLTGDVWGSVVEPEGKALVLKKILDEKGLSPQDCVVVADDRNNLPMFSLCALRIGYNPDFMVGAKSDFVVKGGLPDVLLPITGKASGVPRPILSRNEIVREAIHISGFLVPFICKYLLKPHLVSLLILLITLLYAASELARLKGVVFPLLPEVTRRAAIQPELYNFATDPIFFGLGVALPLILFPESSNYAAVAILALGDSFAMISGKMWGRTVFPFNRGKRVEGTVFGFLFAFMGASFFVGPGKALIGAAVGMLVECLPLPSSDNLTVPIASGIAMTLVP